MVYNKEDYTRFLSKIRRSPTSEDAYRTRAGRGRSKVNEYNNIEVINEIIKEGDPAKLRGLSRYFLRKNGLYNNVILMYSNLLLYQTVVSPIFDTNKKVSKDKILAAYNKACKFVDDLNVPVNFARATYEMLSSGIYYGILRNEGEGVTLQDLPVEFCRTRFKDHNNLNILEFNLVYFDRMEDARAKKEALTSFPPLVRSAYHRREKGKLADPWIEIPPFAGGACFYYMDKTPIFVSSIPSIMKLEEAEAREAKRDENELYKLLINKIPLDKENQPIFELEEVGEIHEAMAEMLRDLDTVDIISVFGDARMESIQDTTAASQSADRIRKYKQAAYDQLGVSAMRFNADGSSALPYSIGKDEALVEGIANIYSAWIEYQINLIYAKSNLRFSFSILPTTNNNREKVTKQFFSGAQYGYSKIYAGVALGIKQTDMLPLLYLENDILDLTEKMKPLQSSYTSSGKNSEESAKNNNNAGQGKDIDNSAGRPPLNDEEKSDKTIQNTDGKN